MAGSPTSNVPALGSERPCTRSSAASAYSYSAPGGAGSPDDSRPSHDTWTSRPRPRATDRTVPRTEIVAVHHATLSRREWTVTGFGERTGAPFTVTAPNTGASL